MKQLEIPKFTMSLSKTRRCATCRKTEEQVRLKVCSVCGILTYCSELCRRESWKNHSGNCYEIVGYHLHSPLGYHDLVYRNESLLDIAMKFDLHEALEKAVEGIHKSHLDSSIPSGFLWVRQQRPLLDGPDLICFHIELGKSIFIKLFRLA